MIIPSPAMVSCLNAKQLNATQCHSHCTELMVIDDIWLATVASPGASKMLLGMLTSLAKEVDIMGIVWCMGGGCDCDASLLSSSSSLDASLMWMDASDDSEMGYMPSETLAATMARLRRWSVGSSTLCLVARWQLWRVVMVVVLSFAFCFVSGKSLNQNANCSILGV